jgi:hypothetical protein
MGYASSDHEAKTASAGTDDLLGSVVHSSVTAGAKCFKRLHLRTYNLIINAEKDLTNRRTLLASVAARG